MNAVDLMEIDISYLMVEKPHLLMIRFTVTHLNEVILYIFRIEQHAKELQFEHSNSSLKRVFVIPLIKRPPTEEEGST